MKKSRRTPRQNPTGDIDIKFLINIQHFKTPKCDKNKILQNLTNFPWNKIQRLTDTTITKICETVMEESNK